MAKSKLRSVVSIRVVRKNGESTTVYKNKAKARKQSMGLDAFGKSQRRIVKNVVDSGREYLRRHDRSNQRQKDGWLMDLASNVIKSVPDLVKEARKQAIN